jgi:dTDP-4-amino-4,6-dideoxygalactose transaminase
MEYQYHIFSPYRVCPLGAHVDHQHGLVTGFAIDKGVEEKIFKVGMCLPAGPYVTDEDVRYIVECIKEAIEK